jgi:molecular chaperone GrpE (heat shock protein)
MTDHRNNNNSDHHQERFSDFVTRKELAAHFATRLLSLNKGSTMSDDAEKKPETTEEAETMEEPEDDEEDLEKLQAEIARMEAEAARITKETEELEKKKESKMAAAGLSSDSKAAGGGDNAGRDGYVP